MERSIKLFTIICLVNGEKVQVHERAKTIEEAKQKLIDKGYKLCDTCNG